MVTVPQIKWGSYSAFEGPYFMGSIPYTLPENPTEDDRRLRVVTSTEGATYDAVNMYDQCIISIGLIQWCEASGQLTSRLLHGVAAAGGADNLLKALKPALDLTKAEFKKNNINQWRFFHKGVEVASRAQMQALFLGCDGKKGSWDKPETDPNAKSIAKMWAVCMANVWSDPKAREVQAEFTKRRLTGFIMKDARQLLWDSTPDTGWNGMLRAAYISYAANNPQKANDNTIKAASTTMAKKWSPEWCIHLLKVMTFGTDDKPTPAIYGERYDKIRPWLERLWLGVALPKTHGELKKWQLPKIGEAPSPVTPVPPVIIPPLPPLPEIKQPNVEDVGTDNPAPVQTLPEIIIDVDVPSPAEPTVQVPTPSGGFLAVLFQLLMKLFGKK